MSHLQSLEGHAMEGKLPAARLSNQPFKVVSPYEPSGDQPKAIETLARNIEDGMRYETTHLDPSPLPPCAPSAIRRFNRRADEKAHGVVRCPRAVPHGKIGGTMARTAECAAPEGSQDRDEWMTVIEMQEYMRASRNKAYDLIWSGEIDSYRLGRKLLVSRASVDAYIESRSGRK